VHLWAEPVKYTVAALQTEARATLTAERLARRLGPQPRLVVLDLVLEEADTYAAEQLMIANTFCWHLHRASAAVSVLCGVFDQDAGNRRQLLVDSLAAGRRLSDLLVDLQQSAVSSPHTFRHAISLNTDSPDATVRVEAS
jgi:hypothetical protein